MRIFSVILSPFVSCASAEQAAELVHSGRLVLGKVGGYATEFVTDDDRFGLKFSDGDSSFTFGVRSVDYGSMSTVTSKNYWYAKYETDRIRLAFGGVDPADVGSGIEKIGAIDPNQRTLQTVFLGPSDTTILLLSGYDPSVRADYALGSARVAFSCIKQQGNEIVSAAQNKQVGSFESPGVWDKNVTINESLFALGI